MFSVISASTGRPVVLLMFITLVGTTLTSRFVPNLTSEVSAHHFLIGYVHAQTREADRSLLTDLASEMFRIAPHLALQPVLLGPGTCPRS